MKHDIVVVVVEREEGTHNPSGKNFVWGAVKEIEFFGEF
jgi:hypothetical protein